MQHIISGYFNEQDGNPTEFSWRHRCWKGQLEAESSSYQSVDCSKSQLPAWDQYLGDDFAWWKGHKISNLKLQVNTTLSCDYLIKKTIISWTCSAHEFKLLSRNSGSLYSITICRWAQLTLLTSYWLLKMILLSRKLIIGISWTSWVAPCWPVSLLRKYQWHSLNSWTSPLSWGRLELTYSQVCSSYIVVIVNAWFVSLWSMNSICCSRPLVVQDTFIFCFNSDVIGHVVEKSNIQEKEIHGKHTLLLEITLEDLA